MNSAICSQIPMGDSRGNLAMPSYSLQFGIVSPAKEPIERKAIRGLGLAAVILSPFLSSKASSLQLELNWNLVFN